MYNYYDLATYKSFLSVYFIAINNGIAATRYTTPIRDIPPERPIVGFNQPSNQGEQHDNRYENININDVAIDLKRGSITSYRDANRFES